ncbi:hypothetical protein ACFQ1S_32315, partial [Kibdelosporangium lantanae]
MADQEPLAWLTDWVTEQQAAEPQNPTIDPWAEEDTRAPASTAAARVHPANEPPSPGAHAGETLADG